LSVGLIALLLASGTEAIDPKPAVAAPEQVKAPGPDERPDEASAKVAARLNGHRVEITSQRTETTQVFANPDGTLSMEQAARPVRVQRGETWVPVDTRLRATEGGGVEPVATAIGVRLSSGGTGALATVTDGDRSLALTWPNALPAPTLDGDTATYPEVLPGVDLKIRADVEGFAQVLVVKDRKAASQPGLTALRFGYQTRNVTLKADGDGNMQAVDGAGETVFGGGTPRMWDSSAPETGQGVPDRAADAGTSAKHRAMPTKLGEDVVEIAPDRGLLTASDAQFPLFIDPAFSSTRSHWTMVDQGFPNASYWNSTDVARTGTYDAGAHKLRSFFGMSTSALKGKHVLSATFNAYETWSWSCTAKPVELWLTGGVSSATKWGTQPAWTRKIATVNAAKGYSTSCPAGNVAFNALSAVQEAADKGWTTTTFGLRATSETDNFQWKKFRNNPTIAVTYNSKPAVGTALEALPGTAGSPRFVRSLTPSLSYLVSDPDGGTMPQAKIELWEGATLVKTQVVANVPSGTRASWAVPAGLLVEGHRYKFRTTTFDGTDWTGVWSAWLEFTVDTVKPGAPFISSTDYPSDDTWHGAAGKAGNFTFSPPSGTADLAAYVYKLDTDTAAKEQAATGAATVAITPPTDGFRTLTVQTKDKAANLSAATTYRFQVGRAGISQPLEGANVVRRMKLSVEGDPTLTRGTFQYRRGPGSTEANIPLSNLTTSTGAPVTATKVRLADLGDNAIWNAVDTLGSVGGVVQVRALLYPDSDSVAAYPTQWRTVTVDPNGDGAASTDIGPGSVNLLTGDFGLDSTDVEEFGLGVERSASSRETQLGWLPQSERLTPNQQQVGTDTTGFSGGNATVVRSTTRGQDGSTDSLEITPTATAGNYPGDTWAAVGGDMGGLRLNMKPGKRYRMTAWIYVPVETGLDTTFTARGLKLMGFMKNANGYLGSSSLKAAYTGAWQELQVDLAVPADATEAFFRLYNGFSAGSGKKVYYDNISVQEIVAPFGPQWSGGSGDGNADSEYASLDFPAKDIVRVVGTDGGWLTFARNADGTFFAEPGAEDVVLSKVSDTVYRVTADDGTVSEFTKQAGGSVFAMSATWTSEVGSTTRYLYDVTDGRALVKRVLNPAEPGVGDCTTAVPARGCEVLEYDYATTTTATAQAFGDVVDRVRAVKIWSWDPVAGAETAVEMARYNYDDQGRLREAWDPRVAAPLKNTYGYDSAGRVVEITAPGELPWHFDYAAAGADQHPGHLVKVRRETLAQGSKDQVSGEIATSVVYEVPRTRGAGGPYDMDAAGISRWAQRDLPTDATAVFPPEVVPAGHTASATAPGPDGYRSASVHYLNASAQEVNVAEPGGHIDTTEYDRFGNVVRKLEAANRELALGELPDADALAAELNLPEDSASRAVLLDAISSYSADGQDLVDTLGPSVRVALQSDLADPSGANPTLVAGSEVIARGHEVSRYDEGKPDGLAYHLVTTETEGATVFGYPADADVRVTKHGYGAEKGGTSGWKLRESTSVVADVGGVAMTSYVIFDDNGRATESRGVEATGGDARTLRSISYTAGANAADAACGNKPEWAGQPCVSRYAGAIVGGDGARMPTDLPVKRIEGYSRFGDVTRVSETAAGKTRVTVTQHDGADRVLSTQITSDEGAPLPAVTTEYDPVTGDAVRTTSGDSTLTREFDVLGRLIRYTDADGGVTTNEFDGYGKPVKVSDNTGSTTYAYDRQAEPRGFLTSVTDSLAGTFGAKYGPDGQLVEQSYPGGLTRVDKLDASGEPTQRTYTRDSDGAVVLAESTVENTQGQIVRHTSNTTDRTYRYDRVGRLVGADYVDTAGVCTTRAYEFDKRTNRTRKATFSETGSCADPATATPVVDERHTYDSADRITDAGYRYDAFGRTVALPDGMAVGYFANDLVASQQLGEDRQTWTLDPAHRLRGFTTERLVDGAWANATSKLNHYGDDSDEPRWIVEDTSLGSLTRNVSGPDSDLVATTSGTGDVALKLTNLHGDVAATINTDLTEPVLYDYDEFGNPVEGQEKSRYGWLGGEQRSGEALGDVILMGVRLYSPSLGRFLQVDPVSGGNATAYDYCSGDPVNCTDLDGNWGWKKFFKKVAKVAEYASYIPGPIGTIAGVVSAGAYAATGNWRKAAEVGLSAAANLVGAGGAVKAGFAAYRGIRAASRARRAASFAGKRWRAARNWGRSRCNSFDPETPVVMADGTVRAIADIQLGDYVLSADPRTGLRAPQPVLDVIVGTGTKHLVGIDLDPTDPDELIATAGHPMWAQGRGWVDAEDIAVGDRVLAAGQRATAVAAVRDLGQVPDQEVYNLNVANLHTFFTVVDSAPLLVHNASCGLPHKHARKAPRRGGVYVIKYNNGSVYVGRSKNMHRRMHQHNKRGKLHGAKSIHYHSRSGYLRQRKLEQGMMNRYWHAGVRMTNKRRGWRMYSHY
jgi:RHS repeat-associated protein